MADEWLILPAHWLKPRRAHRHIKSFYQVHEWWQVFFFFLMQFYLTFFLQKAKECYGKVLSGWFLFCGGREWVRQPDGRSLWFSRWLFCVVLSDTGQAHWHAASLPSISSPPLPSPPPPTQSLLRRWIPAPWPRAADPKRMGWDFPLSPPKGNVNVWDHIDDTHLPLSNLPQLYLGDDCLWN